MEILIDVAKQVPALAVLVFLVIRFLTFIKGRDVFIRDLHKESKEVIAENSEVIKENMKISGELLSTLKRMNGKH